MAELTYPATEIMEYLARHPDAQDTLDGIVQWWGLEQRRRESTPQITETIAQLVELGCLAPRKARDGTILYGLRPEKAAAWLSRPARSAKVVDPGQS